MRDHVTSEEIEALINNAKVEISDLYGNVTVCTWQLENGFTITEASGCINPDNYSQDKGYELCREHAISKLWELEGYRAAWDNYNEKMIDQALELAGYMEGKK